MNFLDFYNLDENYIPELYELTLKDGCLCEVNKNLFLTNTDPARIKRARKEVRTRPPKVTEGPGGTDVLEYNFKSFPSTEFKRHQGYVIHKGNDVKEVFCDCKDFFYRLYAPMVKKGLATWDLPSKYKRKLIKPHNKEWTDITNPQGKIYVCKHLYALIAEYVDDDSDIKPIDNKKLDKNKRQEIINKKNQDKENLLKKQKQDLELKKQKDLERKQKFQKNLGKQDQEIKQDVDDQLELEPEEELKEK